MRGRGVWKESRLYDLPRRKWGIWRMALNMGEVRAGLEGIWDAMYEQMELGMAAWEWVIIRLDEIACSITTWSR